MLFVFRGVRVFQLLMAVVALATGVGAVLAVKAVADGGSPFWLAVAVALGLVFLWAFGTALRAPTSFVAVADERTRIRFAGFIDTVVANDSITGVRLRNHRPWHGVGVWTNFGGDVALVSSPGLAAEIVLRQPVRVWLLPKVIPIRARRLTVSIRNPQKLLERFGPAPTAAVSSPPSARARKMKRRGS